MFGEDLPARLEEVRRVGPVGHFSSAHTVLGWCALCPGRSAEAEAVAWRDVVLLEALVERGAYQSGEYVPTVEVDFDGPLHAYTGWNGGEIGEMREGAAEVVAELLAGYAVVVCTARRELGAVAAAVRRWFGVATITDVPEGRTEFWSTRGVILVTNRKYPAVAYFDDRAFCVAGRADGWAAAMARFRELHGEAAVPGPGPLRAAADRYGTRL